MSKISTRQVKVGGEIGRRMDITINNNLLVLDADQDFLRPFQERDRNGGYIGLGKLIDSIVRFAAHTEDDRLIQLKKHVVEETLKTQEDDGYIGIMVPEKRMWSLWDIHEMAYLVNGLITDYHFFSEQSSLDSAVKLMDYIISRWTVNPNGLDHIDITVFMAVTGLEEALLMLYEETGDEKYVKFCTDFRKLPEWDTEIVLGRWAPIAGHAYAYMHRCLAQLRLHKIRHNPRLFHQSRGVIDFLIQKNGLTINGVCGQHECWHDTQDGTEGLGETCATAYLLRLLDELLQLEGNSLYGDIMERAIYNGLFAAQSPDGRRLRYYVPFEGPREYFHGDTYCCPCNYRRIISELPTMVYYRRQNGIAVNLYTPSQAQIDMGDRKTVTITQETDYPNSGNVVFKIESNENMSYPLFLRIPRWCEKAEVFVNDKLIHNTISPGSFLKIEREWQSGDQLELKMEMPFRFIKGREAQAGRVAIMRGPQLFGLSGLKNTETNGLDLRQVLIDPNTLEGPVKDTSVRPDGLACRIKGWKTMGFSMGGNHNLKLYLTEFPDPDGIFTYFRIRKMGKIGDQDELYRLH